MTLWLSCYVKADFGELRDWCSENLNGRFFVSPVNSKHTSVRLNRKTDIVRFKLRWWDEVFDARTSGTPPIPKELRATLKAESDQRKEDHRVHARATLDAYLAQADRPHQQMIDLMLAYPPKKFSARELDFLDGASQWLEHVGPLTPKQAQWVENLAKPRKQAVIDAEARLRVVEDPPEVSVRDDEDENARALGDFMEHWHKAGRQANGQ